MRAKPDEGWPVFVCLWAKCQRMCCVCLSRHRGRRHAEGRRRLGGGRNQHGTAVRWVTLQGRYSALLTRGIERCLPEPSVKTPVTPKRERLMLTCAENRSLCFIFPHSVRNLSVLEEPPPLLGLLALVNCFVIVSWPPVSKSKVWAQRSVACCTDTGPFDAGFWTISIKLTWLSLPQ